MKQSMQPFSKQLLFIVCCILSTFLQAQNIGIGTTAPAEKLEIKNALRSTVKISSGSFTDTSQLIFSNRDASAAGTDFLITSKQEQGLFFTSKSDFGSNTNDSSLVIKPNGNIGIGVTAPSAKLQVNGNAMINGFNAVEFGGGVTKEINAGKIGYETFTTDALDIVGAGITSGNRKIKFWNEGGATFAGPVNLNSTLQLNNDAGTSGQVLTSNGTAAPTWRNTSFGNTTRFAATGAGNKTTRDMNLTTLYNTNTADISIGATSITINKTGLYHIEGNMDLEADYFPNAAYPPFSYLYMIVNNTLYLNLMRDLMIKDGAVSGSQERYYFMRLFTTEIYLTAGSVLKFDPASYPDTGTVNFLAYYTFNVRGHLISE